LGSTTSAEYCRWIVARAASASGRCAAGYLSTLRAVFASPSTSKKSQSSPLCPCVMYSRTHAWFDASTTHEQLIASSRDHDGQNGTARQRGEWIVGRTSA